MSTIVRTDTGTRCCICLEDFRPQEEKFSHKGATHDGFHKSCIQVWMKTKPICPLDRTPLGFSLRDLVVISAERCTSELVNVARATCTATAFVLGGLGAFVAGAIATGRKDIAEDLEVNGSVPEAVVALTGTAVVAAATGAVVGAASHLGVTARAQRLGTLAVFAITTMATSCGAVLIQKIGAAGIVGFDALGLATVAAPLALYKAFKSRAIRGEVLNPIRLRYIRDVAHLAMAFVAMATRSNSSERSFSIYPKITFLALLAMGEAMIDRFV